MRSVVESISVSMSGRSDSFVELPQLFLRHCGIVIHPVQEWMLLTLLVIIRAESKVSDFTATCLSRLIYGK